MVYHRRVQGLAKWKECKYSSEWHWESFAPEDQTDINGLHTGAQSLRLIHKGLASDCHLLPERLQPYVEYTANDLIVTTSASDLQKYDMFTLQLDMFRTTFFVSTLRGQMQNLTVKSSCPVATGTSSMFNVYNTVVYQQYANSYEPTTIPYYTILTYTCHTTYTILYHTSEEPKWSLNKFRLPPLFPLFPPSLKTLAEQSPSLPGGCSPRIQKWKPPCGTSSEMNYKVVHPSSKLVYNPN